LSNKHTHTQNHTQT